MITITRNIDSFVHPVRMRIIASLAMYGPHTPAELKQLLEHVPQATLYRNIQYLRDEKVIEVADSKIVKGNIEYSYKINYDQSTLKADDLAMMSVEEKRLLFLQYTAMINEYYRSYVEQIADEEADRSTIAMAPLNLTDNEYTELEKEIQELILSKVGKEKTTERKPRLLSLVLIPELQNNDKLNRK